MQLYFDLFDDELYPLRLYEAGDLQAVERVDYLENIIRLQMLLAILGGKSIVIPEQWGVSSATFLKLASEVASGYMVFANRHEDNNKVRLKPPFRLAYYTNEVEVKSYADVFSRRLDSESRIRCSLRLDDRDIRDSFSYYLKNIDYEVSFGVIKQEVNGFVKDVDLAGYIAKLIIYFKRYAGRMSSYSLDDYIETNRDTLERVKEFCRVSDASGDVERDLHSATYCFLNEASKKKNIGRLMELWDMLKDDASYTIKQKIFIENIGRNTLHSSLSSVARANYSSYFHGTVNAKTDRRILSDLDAYVKQVVGEGQRYSIASSGSIDLIAHRISGEKFEDSSKNSIVRKPWNDAWEGIFELTINKDFNKFLNSYKSRFSDRILVEGPDGASYYSDEKLLKEINSFVAELNSRLIGLNFSPIIDSNYNLLWRTAPPIIGETCAYGSGAALSYWAAANDQPVLAGLSAIMPFILSLFLRRTRYWGREARTFSLDGRAAGKMVKSGNCA